MRSAVCVWVWAVLAIGCAHRNPYFAKKEWQEGQAKAAAPAELEREDKSWRAFRTLKVRVYVDPAFIKAEGNATQHCEARFQRANEVLEPALAARLELEEVRELPVEARSGELEQILPILIRIDEGEDVDFVLALLGAQPIATLSFHDLGRASVLGRHVAIRSMDDAQELRAIEGFDALDAEARSQLYQQRKRHKETAVLLHELGHTLGALHARAGDDLMHPTYASSMQAFAPENIELMKLVLAERSRAADERDFAALAKELKARVEHTDQPVFIEEERASYLASLDAAVAPRSRAASGAGSTATAAVSKPSPAADITALPAEDRARFESLDALLAKRDYPSLVTAMDDLATRYPKTYSVQHKACELGMKIGLSFDELRVYCDRMATLVPSAVK